ncbi:hypothetical protein E2C01_084801 [Portunus trituberculatus]|uniref:Uncharacterized protein n=1 Tax=Portunus trituberculatus TaxID=210409 RepID=A0A5B7IZ89_PORTR|nr:hypothetical protein [Portunus trituberculatus]
MKRSLQVTERRLRILAAADNKPRHQSRRRRPVHVIHYAFGHLSHSEWRRVPLDIRIFFFFFFYR